MIRKKQTPTERIIDLTGPDGNAFVLLGYAKSFARQCGFDEYEIMEEMKAGDYEHLIKTFDNYFGGFVILER